MDAPSDTLVDVGSRVRISVGLSGLSAAVRGKKKRRVSLGSIAIDQRCRVDQIDTHKTPWRLGPT